MNGRLTIAECAKTASRHELWKSQMYEAPTSHHVILDQSQKYVMTLKFKLNAGLT